jgi:predicted SprT family Zn-dependent metalloprotease
MVRNKTITSPNRQYVTLDAAFDFFNRELFDGDLPPTIITLQRQAGSYGYYSAQRFESRAKSTVRTDEIALNPATFKERHDGDILSTLVHEMVHHWQLHFGNPGRGRYHNKEWADHMELVGLIPSNTGQPGGKRTGQQMTHYIQPNGRFFHACRKLLKNGAQVEWQSREPESRTKPPVSKQKYSCPECGLNAWAKPGVHLVCGECAVRMK